MKNGHNVLPDRSTYGLVRELYIDSKAEILCVWMMFQLEIALRKQSKHETFVSLSNSILLEFLDSRIVAARCSVFLDYDGRDLHS